jgi:hypothetical protein
MSEFGIGLKVVVLMPPDGEFRQGYFCGKSKDTWKTLVDKKCSTIVGENGKYGFIIDYGRWTASIPIEYLERYEEAPKKVQNLSIEEMTEAAKGNKLEDFKHGQKVTVVFKNPLIGNKHGEIQLVEKIKSGKIWTNKTHWSKPSSLYIHPDKPVKTEEKPQFVKNFVRGRHYKSKSYRAGEVFYYKDNNNFKDFANDWIECDAIGNPAGSVKKNVPTTDFKPQGIRLSSRWTLAVAPKKQKKEKKEMKKPAKETGNLNTDSTYLVKQGGLKGQKLKPERVSKNGVFGWFKDVRIYHKHLTEVTPSMITNFTLEEESKMMSELKAEAHTYVTSEDVKRIEKVKSELKRRTQANILEVEAIREGTGLSKQTTPEPNPALIALMSAAIWLVTIGSFAGLMYLLT